MEKAYLGIDIGGTKNAVIVGSSRLEILEKKKFKSGSTLPPEKILNELLDACQEIISRFERNNYQFKAVGISCGGPLDSKTGTIYSPPNLPLWDSIQITDFFEKHLGLPTYLQNDADACALAEWNFGNGRGFHNFIFLTFGTGLGAGLILNDRLYSGTNGLAGEVGHIRLEETGPVGHNKIGSFEGFCSGGGIRELGQLIIRRKWDQGEAISLCKNEEELQALDTKKIFLQAASGDKTALEIVSISAEHLGKGLSILIDLLNPQCIVLGGVYTRGEHLLRPKMLDVIHKEALSCSRKVCEIRSAGLGENIGDIASLTVAMMGEKSRTDQL